VLAFVFKHPLILALAIALIVLGGYLAWRKHHLVLRGHLSDGEIIELIPHRGSKGGYSYSLRVSYTIGNGNKSEFVTTFSSSPPMHALHEKIRVVYYDDATAPDILAYPEMFLFPWICVCAGLFILLMCGGYIVGPMLIDSYYVPHMAKPDPSRAYLR
jgi:hypothetical protein